MTNIEQFLTALLNGETLDIVPRTRFEAYLKNCCEGCGCDGLPDPLTRADALLYALAEKLAGGGGGSSDDGDDFEITSAYQLFYDGHRLSALEALCAKIKNCANFYRMFCSCNTLETIPQLDTSDGTTFEGMFDGCSAITTIPQLDTSNGTNFSSMFSGCKKLTTIHPLETGNGTNFNSMFKNCYGLTTVHLLDTGNGTNFRSMFEYCNLLTTIPQLDVGNATELTYIFSSCSRLTDLYLYNIRRTIAISASSLLTVDSLVHIIKELCTVTTSQTLTIGSANLEKIANVYCKIIDDTHEKKTMELCESTDDGAMLITNYATEKGWQIK